MVAAMLIASFKTITAMYKPLKRYLRQKARFYKEFRAFFMPQKVSKQKDIFADFDRLHGTGLPIGAKAPSGWCIQIILHASAGFFLFTSYLFTLTSSLLPKMAGFFGK